MRFATRRGCDALRGAAILLAALIALPSCTGDDPSCPAFWVGAVEGHLLEAGRGAAAPIGARALEGPSEGYLVAETMADSTGWYRLELPMGLYRLEVDPSRGGHWYEDRRDVVGMTPLVQRKDLRRGRTLIEVTVPAALEGEQMHLRLNGRDDLYLTQKVADGRLAFDARFLRPGSYRVQLSVWGGGGQGVTLRPTNPTAGDSLTVGPDDLTRLEADLTASYASLSGSVTGSWQEANTFPPWVEAVGQDRYVVCQASCGRDGAFTLHVLTPEPVRLRTRIGNVERWIGGETFETAQIFDLAPGDRLGPVAVVESGIKVVLQGPGDLLYHAPDITLRSETGTLYTETTYSPTSGVFPICNLPPGRYYLRVDGRCHQQIWAPAWYQGVENLEDATPIDLAPGELRTIVMPLVEGGRISGDLLTADGARPDHLSCGLFASEQEPLCQNYRAVEQGRFSFPGLADGQYYLAVRLPYSDRWWYPGTWSFAAASPIVIADRQAVTGLVWRLPATGKEVRP